MGRFGVVYLEPYIIRGCEPRGHHSWRERNRAVNDSSFCALVPLERQHQEPDCDQYQQSAASKGVLKSSQYFGAKYAQDIEVHTFLCMLHVPEIDRCRVLTICHPSGNFAGFCW